LNKTTPLTKYQDKQDLGREKIFRRGTRTKPHLADHIPLVNELQSLKLRRHSFQFAVQLFYLVFWCRPT